VPDVGDYRGTSEFLRWSPKVMLVLAVLVLASGWNHSAEFAVLFGVVAYVHGRWLACRFTVRVDGVELVFPFGRHLFLPKHLLTIRVEMVGAVALVGRRRRFGYPLMDGILYLPERAETLRDAFVRRGYDVA
jgi:hypothetical protein